MRRVRLHICSVYNFRPGSAVKRKSHFDSFYPPICKSHEKDFKLKLILSRHKKEARSQVTESHPFSERREPNQALVRLQSNASGLVEDQSTVIHCY